MINLVIDASAGFELLLNTSDGRALTAKLPAQAESWAPEHYFVEVGGIVRRWEHQGEITAARSAIAIHDLLHADMRRVQIRPLMEAAWQNRGHLTLADALYVTLAEQLKATLVTADLKLANSPGLKVPTITP